ncbi:LytR/AlgR family response regulator transcription factor [Maribellus maritimus]|uniref:LytR/AlgR family response regulator transcription factor n=1 Tax=Maribellus maritimus TaxID=2870838 RepID=UPI001EEB5C0D|nr:LytTR family DNA-binding domain-containing protein [Maribellus maritimus]MCG6191093.1 LytTR family transcriptional regulator [Maribellus maritimus]
MSNNTINQFITLLKKYFKIYLAISISVFLFIMFFQPFPSHKFESENKNLFIAGYGLIIFIIQLIVQIIFQRHLLRNNTDEEYNPLLNSLYYFSQVALTSLAFVFYTRYVGNTGITFNIVLRVIVISLSVPVTIHLKSIFSSMHEKYKNLLEEKIIMQDKLKQFSESYANKFVELNSENESDNIRIQVSEIIFVKSADNYVEVGFRDGGEFRKKMIRNTLKNIEKQLKEFKNFVRTHRSCIVNIQYIDKLNKNFNTYWLTLIDTKETVPVSRQYLMAVKDLF